MWANSVWGFAGAAFACLLGLLGVTDPVIRGWLYFGAEALGGTSVVVLVWPFAVPPSLRWINERRAIQDKQALMFEPVHLISLGLLIAIVGLAWQLFWWQPAASIKIAATNAAPTNTSPAIAATSPKPVKFYSQQDKENLSNLSN